MSGKLSRRGGAVDPFIVMDVMAAAAEKEAAWNAFTKSQEGANAGLRELPAQTHPIMVNIFVGVEANMTA